MKSKIKFVIASLILTTLVNCSDDNGSSSGDGFDRETMLINWADNIIIPAYQNYVSGLNDLTASVETFVNEPSVVNLEDLREDWINAYIAWQSVSMFEIGKAEELTIRNYTNVFPTNVEDMELTIAGGVFDLASVNKQDEQGFPALDYLINGMGDSDSEIVDVYLQETAQSNHDDYLIALVTRLDDMAREVYDDWTNSYRDEFVANDGSDATSSVNKLANDVVFYYEKHLRAGKIGIPAGVFTGSTLSDRVEALYSKGESKRLFIAALNSFRDFFNGDHFGTSGSGEGFRSYLNFLNTIKDGEDLGSLIDNQFQSALNVAAQLDDDFEAQVTNDNTLMLNTYDELQMNVVYMKSDMFQALNVKVDFMDADGD